MRHSCSIAIERMFCLKKVGAFEITCVLIATASVNLASFVYWAVLDQNGASLILIGAASLLTVLTHGARNAVHDCASAAIGMKSDSSAK